MNFKVILSIALIISLTKSETNWDNSPCEINDIGNWQQYVEIIRSSIDKGPISRKNIKKLEISKNKAKVCIDLCFENNGIKEYCTLNHFQLGNVHSHSHSCSWSYNN